MRLRVITRCAFLTQKERDTETGLDYFIARYYSSATGRFTSPDPLYYTASRPNDPQQFNLYAYVRNSPLLLIDPDGRDGQLIAKDSETLEEGKKVIQKIAPGTKFKKDGTIIKPGFFRRIFNKLTGHGAGTTLISRIADSKNHTVIEAKGRNAGPLNVTSDQMSNELREECQCDNYVAFGTKWDGKSPFAEVRQGNGQIETEDYSGAIAVALGHELIHVDTYNRFGSTFDVDADHFFKEGNTTYKETWAAGEFLATGLPFVYNGTQNIPKSLDVTENQLRKELMKTPKPRAAYLPRNNWQKVP